MSTNGDFQYKMRVISNIINSKLIMSEYCSKCSPFENDYDIDLAQWLEPWTHNPLVVGSNPTRRTDRYAAEKSLGGVFLAP